eukprot:6192512-Pleurochrysis_carterae.AAC.1
MSMVPDVGVNLPVAMCAHTHSRAYVCRPAAVPVRACPEKQVRSSEPFSCNRRGCPCGARTLSSQTSGGRPCTCSNSVHHVRSAANLAAALSRHELRRAQAATCLKDGQVAVGQVVLHCKILLTGQPVRLEGRVVRAVTDRNSSVLFASADRAHTEAALWAKMERALDWRVGAGWDVIGEKSETRAQRGATDVHVVSVTKRERSASCQACTSARVRHQRVWRARARLCVRACVRRTARGRRRTPPAARPRCGCVAPCRCCSAGQPGDAGKRQHICSPRTSRKERIYLPTAYAQNGSAWPRNVARPIRLCSKLCQPRDEQGAERVCLLRASPRVAWASSPRSDGAAVRMQHHGFGCCACKCRMRVQLVERQRAEASSCERERLGGIDAADERGDGGRLLRLALEHQTAQVLVNVPAHLVVEKDGG